MSARRSGFTLIEVLLASVLTTLVGLAVAQVLFVTQRAHERVQERGRRRALVNALERRLQSDLRGVLPPGGLYAAGLIGEATPAGSMGDSLLPPELEVAPADGAEEPPPVDGRDRLTLAVFPPATTFGDELPLGEGSAWQVIYYIDDDSSTEERGLVRAVTRVRDPVTGAEPEPVQVLSENVIGMTLGFFDGTQWTETWDSGATEDLPRAVQIRLAVIDGDEVVEVRLDVSPPTARPGQVPEATS